MNIFNSSGNTSELLAESVKRMKAEVSTNRRKMVQMFLDYYDGDNTNQYITNRFNINNFREVPPLSFNITKRLIDKMARLYQLKPSRTISGNNEQYQDLIRYKNHMMNHVEKMTKLLGSVALKVTIKEVYGKACFKYEPIMSYDVTTSELDPLEITSIKYPIYMNVDDGSKGNEIVKFAYFDKDHYMVVDEEDGIIHESENPYGVLPFVFLNRSPLIDSVYSAGAYDIVTCNQALDILFTELALGLRFQIFGQYVAEGVYEEEKFERWGSDQVITVPDGVNVKLMQPMPNIDSALKVARSMVELVATNNHMNVSFAETSRDRPQSGIALKIKELENHNNFQAETELWSYYEQEIYDLERILAESNGIKLSDDFGIDFHEPQYPQTTPDEIAMNQFMLDNNLTTKSKLLKKYNDDLTIEQAKKIVEENEEENGKGTEEPEGTEEPKPTQSVFGRVRERITTTQ